MAVSLKIGILGGTFDPIHVGHLIVAEDAREQLGLDQVLFIPTGRPWLRAGMKISDSMHRLEMARIATESNAYFKLSSMEIDRPGETYTRDTLLELRKRLPQSTRVFFILGQDSYNSFDRWREPREILGLCTLVVLRRPGYRDVDMGLVESIAPGASERVISLRGALIEVSGTDIRRRVAEGRSIRYRTPRGVEEYIYKQRLYVDEGDHA